jgi:hypothetical protein
MRAKACQAFSFLMCCALVGVGIGSSPGGQVRAQDRGTTPEKRTVMGVVQNQDLRRVAQAIVQIRDQEGNTVAQTVSDEAGEFRLAVPSDGTFSVSAIQDTYRSEYQIIHLGTEPHSPVTLTLSQTKEIALEVVSPLAPIQYKASSETYSLSRKEVESLPRGNNNELHDVLLTIPSAAYGALKQVHIRQDHSNLQFRIDGVPIPDTVSSTFSDVITPRAWERADIIRGLDRHHHEERDKARVWVDSDLRRIEPDGEPVVRIWRHDRGEISVLPLE